MRFYQSDSCREREKDESLKRMEEKKKEVCILTKEVSIFWNVLKANLVVWEIARIIYVSHVRNKKKIMYKNCWCEMLFKILDLYVCIVYFPIFFYFNLQLNIWLTLGVLFSKRKSQILIKKKKTRLFPDLKFRLETSIKTFPFGCIRKSNHARMVRKPR